MYIDIYNKNVYINYAGVAKRLRGRSCERLAKELRKGSTTSSFSSSATQLCATSRCTTVQRTVSWEGTPGRCSVVRAPPEGVRWCEHIYAPGPIIKTKL